MILDYQIENESSLSLSLDLIFLFYRYLFFITLASHIKSLNVKGEGFKPFKNVCKSSRSFRVIRALLTRLASWVIHTAKLDIGLRCCRQLHLRSGLSGSQLKR